MCGAKSACVRVCLCVFVFCVSLNSSSCFAIVVVLGPFLLSFPFPFVFLPAHYFLVLSRARLVCAFLFLSPLPLLVFRPVFKLVAFPFLRSVLSFFALSLIRFSDDAMLFPLSSSFFMDHFVIPNFLSSLWRVSFVSRSSSFSCSSFPSLALSPSRFPLSIPSLRDQQLRLSLFAVRVRFGSWISLAERKE